MRNIENVFSGHRKPESVKFISVSFSLLLAIQPLPRIVFLWLYPTLGGGANDLWKYWKVFCKGKEEKPKSLGKDYTSSWNQAFKRDYVKANTCKSCFWGLLRLVNRSWLQEFWDAVGLKPQVKTVSLAQSLQEGRSPGCLRKGKPVQVGKMEPFKTSATISIEITP